MEGFRYEPHAHTAETSKCGHLPAAQVVDRYKAQGFSGLVITDHLHNEYLSRVDRTGSWDAVVDHFLTGYRAARARGEEVGLDVLLGAELRFPENDNDYLVYGFDEAWLRANPYLCRMSARAFFAKYHGQVLIIHAHPYRDGNTEVFEDAVHGAELLNASPRHGQDDKRTLELCRRHPEYLRLAGSDTHRPGDEARAGVVLPERVRTSADYRALLQARRFRLWSRQFPAMIQADEAMRKEGI